MRAGQLCSFHKKGVPAHVRADSFFKDGCPACLGKLAAGIVTVDTPPPKVRSRYVACVFSERLLASRGMRVA